MKPVLRNGCVVAVLRAGRQSLAFRPPLECWRHVELLHMGGGGVGVCGGVPSGVPHALPIRSGAGQVYRASQST